MDDILYNWLSLSFKIIPCGLYIIHVPTTLSFIPFCGRIICQSSSVIICFFLTCTKSIVLYLQLNSNRDDPISWKTAVPKELFDKGQRKYQMHASKDYDYFPKAKSNISWGQKRKSLSDHLEWRRFSGRIFS